jgi:hypothetical protein
MDFDLEDYERLVENANQGFNLIRRIKGLWGSLSAAPATRRRKSFAVNKPSFLPLIGI